MAAYCIACLIFYTFGCCVSCWVNTFKCVNWWLGGYGVGLVINRSRVRLRGNSEKFSSPHTQWVRSHAARLILCVGGGNFLRREKNILWKGRKGNWCVTMRIKNDISCQFFFKSINWINRLGFSSTASYSRPTAKRSRRPVIMDGNGIRHCERRVGL